MEPEEILPREIEFISLIVTFAPIAPIEPKSLNSLSSVIFLPSAVIVAAPLTVAAAL
jgi:hypothetical protein